MALKPYVVVATHPVGLPGGTVGAHGDTVRLDPEQAAPHVRAGDIAEPQKKTPPTPAGDESSEDA